MFYLKCCKIIFYLFKSHFKSLLLIFNKNYSYGKLQVLAIKEKKNILNFET